MFGPEDRYLCLYANMNTVMPALPLINNGTPLAEPVYVHDVARAIKNIVLDPSMDGQTYELVGPDQYTQKQIVEYVLEQTGSNVGDGHHRSAIPLPKEAAPILEMIGTAVEYAAGAFTPPVTADMTKLLTLDHIASGNHPGLAELMVCVYGQVLHFVSSCVMFVIRIA
jgi:NADH dehydrogenase